MSQRNYTEVQSNLHAALNTLLNHIANQKGHNTLALVILDHIHYIGGIISLAQHNGNAGDIACYKGNAQRTDDGVGNKADSAVLRVRICALHILESLNNLRSYRCGKAGIQGIAQILLIGNQAL